MSDDCSPIKKFRRESHEENETDPDQHDEHEHEISGEVGGSEGTSGHEQIERENAAAESAMKNFSSITGTDEIYAQTILQDVNWNLEAALEVHFGRESRNTTAEDAEQIDPSLPIDLAGLEVSLMTWNIDGLDGNSLNTRMKAVYCVLKRINPDFVFLQEVVERGIEPIEKLRKFYNIYYSNRGALYFTAILVSKMFHMENHEVIHFGNSGMGRTLQIIEGGIGPQKVFLLNTHLESMAEHSDKRRVQIAECLRKVESLQSSFPNSLIFFGGDLNIRDNEMPPLPRGVADAWMASGADNKQKWTWDSRANDNKYAGGARCRFDRIFWRGPLRNVDFELEGRQRIRTTLCFPSDHWAVYCNFKA